MMLLTVHCSMPKEEQEMLEHQSIGLDWLPKKQSPLTLQGRKKYWNLEATTSRFLHLMQVSWLRATQHQVRVLKLA